MKLVINATRLIVGVLFVFSGLVKANDPLGLSYKMDEFFAKWNWNWAPRFSLSISVAMIAFEIFAGVALLLGWKPKLITRLLLLLIVFFTFLTGYAYLSGKFHSCGCFGDCIPITSGQSFTKDLLLLVLCIILAAGWRKIQPLFRPALNTILLSVFTIASFALMAFVLLHLPVKDCLPYAEGKNLIDQMKLPPGAIPDSTVIYYKYKKDGKELRFDADHFPADFDENTYEYVDREDVIVRPHTGAIAIQDFALKTLDGKDTTQEILNKTGRYLLFFAKDFDGRQPTWQASFDKVLATSKQKEMPLLLVSNMDSLANAYFNVQKEYTIPILVCDATPMKTFLRSNTGLILMNGPVIERKLNIRDADKFIE
jgi:uncharacterized membrane protein YphA (DoxX/SURF4 family)